MKAYLAGVQARLRAAERERAAGQARAEEARKTAEAEQARADEAKKRAAAEEARAEAAERAVEAEQARAEEARKTAAVERQARRRTVWAAVAVLLVLVAGTVVSTLFAFKAEDQAGVAAKKAEDAIRAEKEKTKALEEVETTLIASLLRPIGQKEGPLDPIEVEAFTTLGGLSSDDTRVRFIETGLRTPKTARRLGRRAEWVIQAAVGLDAGRRRRVEELLMRHLDQPEAPDEVREVCVSLGIALEVQDPSFKELTPEFIFSATVKSINGNDLSGLPARLRAVSGHLLDWSRSNGVDLLPSRVPSDYLAQEK